jgi:hypothetical protein
MKFVVRWTRLFDGRRELDIYAGNKYPKKNDLVHIGHITLTHEQWKQRYDLLRSEMWSDGVIWEPRPRVQVQINDHNIIPFV